MKLLHSKTRTLIFLIAIMLVILAFPRTLHARDMRLIANNSVDVATHNRPTTYQDNLKFVKSGREHQRIPSSLLDRDIRVRAATVIMSDPTIRKSAGAARVPLTVVVITAPVILDV